MPSYIPTHSLVYPWWMYTRLALVSEVYLVWTCVCLVFQGSYTILSRVFCKGPGGKCFNIDHISQTLILKGKLHISQLYHFGAGFYRNLRLTKSWKIIWAQSVNKCDFAGRTDKQMDEQRIKGVTCVYANTSIVTLTNPRSLGNRWYQLKLGRILNIKQCIYKISTLEIYCTF